MQEIITIVEDCVIFLKKGGKINSLSLHVETPDVQIKFGKGNTGKHELNVKIQLSKNQYIKFDFSAYTKQQIVQEFKFRLGTLGVYS